MTHQSQRKSQDLENAKMYLYIIHQTRVKFLPTKLI